MKENDIREDMNGIKSEILRDDEERKRSAKKIAGICGSNTEKSVESYG